MNQIIIHTDGACYRNPGPGGLAARMECGDLIRYQYGYVADTTNNRMAMQAIISGMQYASVKFGGHSYVTVFTDSKNIQDGYHTLLPAWQRRGWKGVANRDLWFDLINQADRFQKFRIKWISTKSYNPRMAQATTLSSWAINLGTTGAIPPDKILKRKSLPAALI